MDFLTASLVSGAVYDIFKTGLTLSVLTLKEKLKQWTIDEMVGASIITELEKLQLNDEMSEIAIERKLDTSQELLNLISIVKTVSKANTITQIHSGSGDNVGGDKYVR